MQRFDGFTIIAVVFLLAILAAYVAWIFKSRKPETPQSYMQRERDAAAMLALQWEQQVEEAQSKARLYRDRVKRLDKKLSPPTPSFNKGKNDIPAFGRVTPLKTQP